MQPKIKIDGNYITIPEAVKEFGELNFRYIKGNNSIQVRTSDNKFIGNLKYDYEFKTISE